MKTKEIFDRYLLARKNSQKGTYNSIKSAIKVWGAKLPKETDEITKSAVLCWLNDIKAKRKTIRPVFFAIKPAFDLAVSDGLLAKNPFSGISMPSSNIAKIECFKQEEIKILLDNAQDYFKLYLAVAFYTGARSGEILALTWDDINFLKKEIYISKSLSNGIVSNTTKTKVDRIVPLFDELLPYLKNFAKNQSKWIFCDKKGGHFFGSPTLRKHWLKLISKTGIPYKPLRQTRHTFATYMVKKALKKDSKIELFWVSKILGHSTLKMTIDTYVRMFKDEHLKIDRDIDFY